MRKLILCLLLGSLQSYADSPSVHGMLIFGQQKTYLSHLPMFHSPHDYQAIFEVNLSDEAKTLYREDQKSHPEETVYTWVPERFDLSTWPRSRRPILATLYRGHFERGAFR